MAIESRRRIILKPKVHRGKLSAENAKIAIVVSRWNDFLTDKLVDGALDALASLGASEETIEIFKVPGSFELPPTAMKLAKSGRFDAIIALGVVIRGETPHFDYVAGEAAKGIGNAAMQSGMPVIFGVVTTNTVEQAINRCGVKAGNKGYEAAMAAVEMIGLYREIDGGKENKAFQHVV